MRDVEASEGVGKWSYRILSSTCMNQDFGHTYNMCKVNITIEVIGAQLVWVDPDFNPVNTTDEILTGSGMKMDDLIVSLDLTLNDVNVTNVGVQLMWYYYK